MKVKVRQNSPFDLTTAKLVAKAANEIIQREALTREAFKEYSRNPKACTHKLFKWDVNEAAEAYWTDQAGKLLGCVYVVNDVTKKEARAYYSVVASTEDGPRRSYRPLGEVVSDENMLGQISLESYERIRAECDKMEALGCNKDPAWKRIIAAVRASVPLAAK